ncbi:Retrovirus-related Pol polyprotein from transposon opus [Dissostichus eleginoides]|uniref:Retrovirus-related Pol polyprotein from transposon opus n=1 Tax=Dissostichus eleginoides TaxID=100907 RepID=A0AAD9FLP9_DISEL|nr:Retrovirus-related Pol polyprotein from transposon opus [Dissostichus eleginoides]
MCSEEEDEWIETVQLNEETVFKLDTGASVTAISSSNYSSKNHGPLQPLHKVLYGPGNHRLKVKGRFEAEGVTADPEKVRAITEMPEPTGVDGSGQNVWLPREEKQGTVIQQATTPRSYVVRTDEGQVRRNCAHLRPMHHPQPQVPPDETVTITEQSNTDSYPGAACHEESHRHTVTNDTPYGTTSGRVSRPPERLNL